MSNVDDRVVSMKFDNQQFEKGVAQTTGSVEKLKSSLNFSGATKGLENLSKAAAAFSMQGMTAAIENVSGRFLAMGAVGFTVISNLTNRVVNFGTSLVKSLTFAPINAGFREYETNMNSVQTILANTNSKGTKIEDVTAALDELNNYADKTIYNFSEMARNIGTFTAAGVDLKTSTAAIKGIANLAAVSGSSAQQASSAMYQLSQAMASGQVRLIDWISVNNAGMGGEVFQRSLFETGKAMKTIKGVDLGTTFEEWQKSAGTFRTTLDEGWLTTAVLTQTLQGFTGDLSAEQLTALGYTKQQTLEILKMGQIAQDAATKVKTVSQLMSTIKEAVGSGWATSYRLVFGDFEEAKAMFTDVYNSINKVVGGISDARNEILASWNDLGGRTILIESLGQAFGKLNQVLMPIKLAFRTIFPKNTGKQLFELTKRFEAFVDNFKIGGETLGKLGRVFRGIFAGFEIGITIVKNIAGMFKDFLGILSRSKSSSGFLDFLANIGDKIVRLNEKLVTGGGIRDIRVEIEKFVLLFQAGFKTLDKSGENFKSFAAKFGFATREIVEDFKKFFRYIESGYNGLNTHAEGFKGVAEKLGLAVKFIKDKIKEIGSGDGISVLGDAIGNVRERFAWLPAAFTGLGNGINWFLDLLAKVGPAIKNGIGSIWDKIKEAFASTEYQGVLDSVNVGLLGGIAYMFHKFAGSGFAGFFGQNLTQSISKSFNALTNTLQSMQQKVKADILMKIATAVGVLTAAVLVLSMIDSKALTVALAALAVGFGQLIGTMAILNANLAGPKDAAKLATVSTAMISISSGLLILAGAVAILGRMDPVELAAGMAAITGMLGIMTAALLTLSANDAKVGHVGLAMISIAAALDILSLAVIALGQMSADELAKGLGAIALMLGTLTGATILMSKNAAGFGMMGLGLMEIAAALTILAGAVKLFGSMSYTELGKGLGTIGVSLLIIAGAMHLMPKDMAAQGAGLALIGAGLVGIATSMKIFGSMSWGEIAKSIVALAGSLYIIAGAVTSMETALGGAAALLVVTAALMGIVIVMKQLGEMSLLEIGAGLLAIFAVFSAITSTAALLQPMVPALMAFGGALLLVGAGFALFGAGAALVAKAIELLAKTGKVGIDALIALFDALISKIPDFIASLVDGFLLIADKLLAAAPKMVEQLSKLIGVVLKALIKNVPKFGELVVTIIDTMISVIKKKAPDLIAAGFELLINFLKGIKQNIGQITKLVAEIIVEFLDALSRKIGDISAAGVKVLAAFIQGMIDGVKTIGTKIGELIVALAVELGKLGAKLAEGAADMLIIFIDGMIDAIGDVSDKILEFIEALIGAIVTTLVGAVGLVIDGFVTLFETLATEIENGGTKLGKAFGKFVKSLYTGVFNAVKSAFEEAIPFGSTITSIGNVLGSEDEIGGGDVTVVIEGGPARPPHSAPKPSSASGQTSGRSVSSPVIDLTAIQKGAAKIGAMLSGNQVNPSVSYSAAALLSAISNATFQPGTTQPAKQSDAGIKFEQNIFAPKALSTSEIYKQTRNQISLAKKELQIV